MYFTYYILLLSVKKYSNIAIMDNELQVCY